MGNFWTRAAKWSLLNKKEIDEDWATKSNWICNDQLCPNPYTHARGDPCKITMEDLFPSRPEPPTSEDTKQPPRSPWRTRTPRSTARSRPWPKRWCAPLAATTSRFHACVQTMHTVVWLLFAGINSQSFFSPLSKFHLLFFVVFNLERKVSRMFRQELAMWFAL